MNDELTTQVSPAPPIVLKLKKFDDPHPNVVLPHTSHLSTETIDDGPLMSATFIRTNETPRLISSSPSGLRVKFNKSLLNGSAEHSDDEHANPTSSDRPAKRSRKLSSNDHSSNNTSNTNFNNDSMSSQPEKQTIDAKPEYCLSSEPSTSPSLVLKIRRDSLTTTATPPAANASLGIPSIVETEPNRQLLVKLKKNEYGELTSNTDPIDSSMSMECLLNEPTCSTKEVSSTLSEAIHTNGHGDTLYQPLTIQSVHSNNHQSSTSPHITNMLADFNDHANHHLSPSTTVTSESHPATSTSMTAEQSAETHTKELLDEALDSVKNVLMQTFKKNLESGGDLSALKSTLGSDEVAEVFLAKLRESLKRDTQAAAEHESKSHEVTMETEIHSCQTPTPSSCSTAMMSPVMNVVSSPSSSPLLPSLSSMISKTTSPTTIAVPSSPQSQTGTVNNNNNNNKRKSSTPSTNPNRFDGTTEEELAKRLLSDILQPNLDIVFVGINPSLYAVHKGHHYGGPGNHFWKLLHMSGLIPNVFSANDDYRMPQYGIGFTNIVQRPTKAGSDITKDEITAGAEILMQKIKMYRPKIVAFNGRGIYEVYAGNKHFHYGKQPELFLNTDTHVFVMPSSSARCSQLPRAEDKLPFYVGLRKLRDFVNGSLSALNEAEITFPDIKIKDTDDVLQKTIIRISNKPFSELSAETLKPYGDKIPSFQMVSKHISSPSSQQIICSSPSPSSSTSSTNLVFNTEALTTQTMSILHNTNTNHQQNGNLLTYDQQAQRVYLQNNGNYAPSPPQPPPQPRSSINGVITPKSSFIENSSSNTNAAVLAALASGGHNSSGQSQTTYYQPQTVYVGGGGTHQQQQQQSISYSLPSSITNNSTVINCRSASIPSSTPSSHSSYVIHHPPQTSSSDHGSSSGLVPSSNSQLVSRQLVVVNSSEPLPSFDTILNSSSMSNRSAQTGQPKDVTSSHQSSPKHTLILIPPSVKQISSSQPIASTPTTNPSTIIVPKLSTPSKLAGSTHVDKRSINTTDDGLFVRYEREPQSVNYDQYRFSFVIDEHSPALQKRLRYVSINDL